MSAHDGVHSCSSASFPSGSSAIVQVAAVKAAFEKNVGFNNRKERCGGLRFQVFLKSYCFE